MYTRSHESNSKPTANARHENLEIKKGYSFDKSRLYGDNRQFHCYCVPVTLGGKGFLQK